MSYTGTSVKTMAQEYCDAGTTITDAKALIWINECLLFLGPETRVSSSGNIVAVDSKTWYSLPTGLGAIYSIDCSDGTEFRGQYQIRNGKIRFDAADTYTLYFWVDPTEMSAIGSNVPAHDKLKSAVALYVASRYKSQDDDENQDARRLMGDFERAKVKALDQIDNPVQPPITSVELVYGAGLTGSSQGGNGPLNW